MDARARLLAGGIVDQDVKGVATSVLEARTYAHPALLGRSVVRLSAEAVGDATDVEMAVLGFDPPAKKEAVGRSVLRALGFPGWAVVHDPKHARFALEVMREFRKSARRIRSKPGFARDELVAIAKRLERSVPHFLPSFWEEAGRAFSEEGALQLAAQCFEKARDAEESFKLKVDEDQRSRAYLEFALAGALATKSLTGYASDLTRAFGDKDGYRRFFDLVVQRTRGGVPPWAGMAKDLRKLAKAAGVDATSADRELLAAVLESPAMARAPADFWSAYHPSLVAMARSDERVRARLRWLFPRPSKYARLVPEWLAILEESGATDAFVPGHADAASEPHGATARWASELTAYARHRSYGEPETAAGADLFAALGKIAPRLAAEGVPALLATTSGYWAQFDVDVLEKALELGIALADPESKEERAQIPLNQPFELDPVRVAAHPTYGPLLVEGVANAFGDDDFEARAAGKRGLVAARRAWLAGEIEGMEKGALKALRTGASTIAEKCSAATFAEFPEEAKRLAAVSAAPALQRTLAAGLLDELGWPDFERVAAALDSRKAPVQQHGTVSRPILAAGTKVVVFDGATESAEFTLPTAIAKSVTGMLSIGGALLVHYRDAAHGYRFVWSTDWSAPFEGKRAFGEIQADARLADGSVSIGGRAIHAGDRDLGEWGPLVAEGDVLWQQTRERWSEPAMCVELDPKTGAKGRASWPAAFRAVSELDDGMRIEDVRLLPAPKGSEASPLGAASGHVGWCVRMRRDGRRQAEFEVVRVDGVRWRGPYHAFGVLTFPGGAEPIAVVRRRAYMADGEDTLTLYVGAFATFEYGPAADEDDDDSEAWPGMSGFVRIPRAPWLHYTSPRDEKGSRALRAISTETCRALLDAAADAEGAAQKEAIEAAMAKALPDLTHPLVRSGVAGAVRIASTLEAKLKELAQSGGEGGAGVTDQALGAMLPVSLRSGWVDGPVGVSIARAAAFLAGGKAESIPKGSTRWYAVLPHLARALAFLGTRAAREGDRASLLGLVRAYAESPFAAGMKVRRASIAAEDEAPIAKDKAVGAAWLYEEGDSRYFVHRPQSDDDEDEPARYEVVEAFRGEPRLPRQATLIASEVIETAAERDLLLAVLQETESRGSVPYVHQDALALAELSGQPLAEAALVVLGMPNFSSYATDFLGKELREKLDVKMQDAKLARDKLRELDATTMFALLGSALDGVTAADLFAHSEPGKPAPWVVAMARVFREQGAASALRKDLVDEVRRMLTYGMTPQHVLGPLVEADAAGLRYAPQPLASQRGRDDDALSVGLLLLWSDIWPHLALTLPGGDEYLRGMARASAVLRAALGSADALLPLTDVYVGDGNPDAVLGRLGGERITMSDGKNGQLEGVDNGVCVALKDHYRLRVAIRPGLLPRKDRAKEVAALDAFIDEDDGGRAALDAIRFFQSDGWARWMKRVEDGATPDGQLDADPRVSAPRAIAKARKELGLGADAAALYLQLLALPAPTDKLVTRVNGWDTGELAAARGELLAKKLVVEGKRERAGRDIFLPGGWEKRSSGYALPVETWKLPFFGGTARATIREPVGELYARALERALGDDRPKFEEVAAVRKAKGKKG
jgi:hypothetical protein